MDHTTLEENEHLKTLPGGLHNMLSCSRVSPSPAPFLHVWSIQQLASPTCNNMDKNQILGLFRDIKLKSLYGTMSHKRQRKWTTQRQATMSNKSSPEV